MQFCDECGSLMRAQEGVMVCANDECGFTAEMDEALAETFTSTQKQSTDDVIVTEEGMADEGKPSATDVTCEECGHGEAWYTIKQTASADEPPTRFFKCKNCSYRWREYN